MRSRNIPRQNSTKGTCSRIHLDVDIVIRYCKTDGQAPVKADDWDQNTLLESSAFRAFVSARLGYRCKPIHLRATSAWQDRHNPCVTSTCVCSLRSNVVAVLTMLRQVGILGARSEETPRRRVACTEIISRSPAAVFQPFTR